MEQRACDVRHREGDVIVERLGKDFEPTFLIRVLQRLDFREEVRVTAQRPLGKSDQSASEDIGAFNGDADRHHLVGALNVVRGAVADAPSPVDVKRVVHASAHALG